MSDALTKDRGLAVGMESVDLSSLFERGRASAGLTPAYRGVTLTVFAAYVLARIFFGISLRRVTHR